MSVKRIKGAFQCPPPLPQLTIFPRVSAHSLWFGAPTVAVPALDFDFVRGEGGRVPHDKRVPFDKMFPPVVVHTCLPVAHLVLQARAIVFDGRERLQTAGVSHGRGREGAGGLVAVFFGG